MTTSKHTILYAEDDLDDLFIVRQAFEKHDHINVLHAPDGQRALLMLEQMVQENCIPCLVILDINMPVMNGKETLQAIRNHSQLKNLSVVMFSTSNSQTDAVFAKNHDAMLITKPVDYSDLESIAKAFVDKCNFEINKLTTT